MTRPNTLLDRITVESPCKADWSEMTGDDRVRHCRLCRLNVYDLSEMTRPQAETLLAERGESLCIRLFRRSDGTVVTRDCIKVSDRVRRRVRWVRAAAAALIAVAVTACGGSKTPKPSPVPSPTPEIESTPPRVPSLDPSHQPAPRPGPEPATPPDASPEDEPTPEPALDPKPEAIMGRICIAPTTETKPEPAEEDAGGRSAR